MLMKSRNYVVQHILGMQLPGVTADILQRLAGNFVTLAMNKYASNVVEKCLKDAPDDHSIPIIREIINSPNFLSVIQHPYGNYVAQSALQTAKGSLKEMMINKVQKEYAFLHSHPHGKRVLALARNSKPHTSVTIDILQTLAGNFVIPAMNKYASNAMEKYLMGALDDIIREIINSPNFLSIFNILIGLCCTINITNCKG
ncbi:hypothetical protein OSB04_015942 [Centaurea solstitialis]|uniref:PUM-HD domain-containing protein n=1 Tax=Centaurea solstitialis TaxID=347529 RepID=A0AA38W9D1_9ASTR|nr:hypothetical protein OSB04_015942 [Centaurea solstitialis]